jgi:hypothetical protein
MTNLVVRSAAETKVGDVHGVDAGLGEDGRNLPLQ